MLNVSFKIIPDEPANIGHSSNPNTRLVILNIC